MSQSKDMFCSQCFNFKALVQMQLAFKTAFPKLFSEKKGVIAKKNNVENWEKREETNYKALFSWEPSEWEELDNLEAKLDGSFSTLEDEEGREEETNSLHLMSILERLNMEEELQHTHI